MVLSEKEKESFRVGEFKLLDTARSHIDASKLLFDHEKWPQSCFMAMTALEEIGKGLVFQAVSAGKEGAIGLDFRKGFKQSLLNAALRGKGAHGRKALVGTFTPLILNVDARRRHGRHPISGIDTIEGVVLLARACEWGDRRNSCLYTEVSSIIGRAACPADRVSREDAYIMIVAALEAYAMVYDPFFTFHNISIDQARNPQRNIQTVKEIEQLVQKQAAKIDLDRLDFLVNPKPLQDKAKKFESRNKK